jgi:hypothetical protein
MKLGKSRFEFQIAKVEKLLLQAKSHENPALWLFLNDLRTPMFMLEGLAKMYAQFHNKKEFTKLKETFKEIEDIVGEVDYYAAFVREFSTNESIPTYIKVFLREKTNQKLSLLNSILINKNWINGKQLKSISLLFDGLKWQKEEDEIVELKGFYHEQIQKIQDFIAETTLEFKNVETEVHELRRKLRWLSIYPQGLQGVVQLSDNDSTESSLKKYLTPEVLDSPFNILPVSEKNQQFLFLEKNNFFALSWMIAELGKIKDNGLKINVLKDALQEINFLKDADAYQQAYQILGKDYPTMETLLNQAGETAKTFFDDKILDNLVK